MVSASLSGPRLADTGASARTDDAESATQPNRPSITSREVLVICACKIAADDFGSAVGQDLRDDFGVPRPFDQEIAATDTKAEVLVAVGRVRAPEVREVAREPIFRYTTVSHRIARSPPSAPCVAHRCWGRSS
jgi:hypothetical protein